MIFKVIVAGSRDYNNYLFIESKLDFLLQNIKDEIEIISGTADGPDKLGEKYAIKRGYKLTKMPANWEIHGRSAGYIRNEEMAKYAAPDGACVVFWKNKSKGSKHMIDLAIKYQLKLKVYEV